MPNDAGINRFLVVSLSMIAIIFLAAAFAPKRIAFGNYGHLGCDQPESPYVAIPRMGVTPFERMTASQQSAALSLCKSHQQ